MMKGHGQDARRACSSAKEQRAWLAFDVGKDEIQVSCFVSDRSINGRLEN